MKTAIAIRHLAFEDLGILGPLLNAAGYELSYREAGVDDLRRGAIGDPDLLVVLGGPIGIYQDAEYSFITDEIRLLEARLAADRPTLGICLGAQAMAQALGARVYAGPVKELGWGEVMLTADGRKSCLQEIQGVAMLHWHGDTFDLPHQAIRLASTELYDNQAFGWQKNGLGLQFHGEVPPAAIEKWLIGHAGEIHATAGLTVQGLRAASTHYAPVAAVAGAAMFTRWLQQISGEEADFQKGLG
jgi:GMP synthase (glutamine-hydrolysing)